jgi:hypothetical protein
VKTERSVIQNEIKTERSAVRNDVEDKLEKSISALSVGQEERNVLGCYSIRIFISTPKLNTVQLNAVSNCPNTAGQSLVGLSIHFHARTVPQRIIRN